MAYLIEQLAKRLSHDKMGFDGRVRFCPSCGTQRLHPHDQIVGPNASQVGGKEYWCSLCGFSFNMRPSSTWNLALRLFRESRRTGIPDRRYVEAAIAPEVMREWKREFESSESTDCRRGRAWTMAEKLKRALLDWE